MFVCSRNLAIEEEDPLWINEGLNGLENLLERRGMLDGTFITQTAEDFPDPYDKTTEAAEKLFSRVCDYMDVDRSKVEFEIFPDVTEELKAILPWWSGRGGKHAAGIYTHAMEEQGSNGTDGRRQAVVAIRSSQLKDPVALVATIAHELGHVILLGGGLMDPKPVDHEPMTDLLTVYLGLGIFTANSAGRFKQFQEDSRIGWSMERLAYFREEVFGYGLAKFVIERNEQKVGWERHLSTNVRSYFKRSRAWLAGNPQYVAMPKPIA